MLGYRIVLKGNVYVKGEKEYIKKLLNEEEFKDSLTFSIISSGYATYKFDKNDISIVDLYVFEEDNDDDIVTICGTVIVESSFGTEEYNTHKEISDSYYPVEILCDSNYDVDYSDLVFTVEE